MKKIGLTGGIGSGKSTIGRIFKTLGIPVYDSDKEAKTLIQTNSEIKDSLISIFGEAAFVRGQYNKEFVSQHVFGDKEKLRKLNSVVHPEVKKHFETWCAEKSEKGAMYIIKEAAILFESGASQGLDSVIAINASEEVRLARVMNRDRIELSEIQKRINNQLTDEERSSHADYVIDNSGKTLVTPQVIGLDKIFRAS